MRAKPGDRLKVSGLRLGDPERHAEILEVRGDLGQPPYLVQWPDGHESLVYPGPDIVVVPKHRKYSVTGR